KIDIDQVVREKIPHRVEEQPPAWQNALAAAFGSPRLDNYHDRLKELDRRVLLRYGLNDPYRVIGEERWYGLPTYAAWDSYRYAEQISGWRCIPLERFHSEGFRADDAFLRRALADLRTHRHRKRPIPAVKSASARSTKPRAWPGRSDRIAALQCYALRELQALR